MSLAFEDIEIGGDPFIDGHVAAQVALKEIRAGMHRRVWEPRNAEQAQRIVERCSGWIKDIGRELAKYERRRGAAGAAIPPSNGPSTLGIRSSDVRSSVPAAPTATPCAWQFASKRWATPPITPG